MLFDFTTEKYLFNAATGNANGNLNKFLGWFGEKLN